MLEMLSLHNLRSSPFVSQPAHRWQTKTLAFVLLPWLLVILFVPVHFLSEDDANFIAHLSGVLGHALPCIPYLSYSTNQLLLVAYRWVPVIPWYGLLLYATALWGCVLLVGPLFRRARRHVMLTPLLFVMPLLLYTYALPTFTTSTLLLLFGGYASLMDRVWDKQFDGYRKLLIPTLAIIVACSLRWYLVLHLLVMFPLFFFRRDQARQLLWMALAILCFLGADRLWYALDATPAIKEFARYSYIRAEFHDAKPMQKHQVTQQALTSVGWAPLDLSAFGQWILFDESKFNARRIELYLQHKRLKGLASKWKRTRRNWHDYFVIHLDSFLFVGMFVLSLVGFWLGYQGRIPWSLLWRWAIWMACWCAILMYTMAWRIVPWVFLPLLLYFCCGALWLTLQALSPTADASAPRHALWRPLGLGLILFGILVGFAVFPTGFRTDLARLPQQARQSRWYDQTFALLKKQAPQVRWLVPMELHTQQLWLLSPLDTRGGKRLFRTFPAGMFAQSPVYKKLLKQIGAKDGKGLLRWSIDRQDMLFVAITDESATLHRLWSRYIRHLQLSKHKLSLQRVHHFKGPGVQLSFYRLLKPQG